ncbi:dimethylarginine dimethylaminohydrolase family protein [Salipaludibacillus daqingensis]|uniref:dimethylarginine dimethylaminohydrolase family protein n=1 Tax=Salipaludibacillus daqingensis TaxID=3041001 RepID=UPI0024750E91|nr:arginine deiminase family protein [Salipaludibacillus daqingensis]
MYKQIIVKKPSNSFVNGLTTVNLGKPNIEKVLEQHNDYVEAMKKAGVSVKVLERDENYPDSTFVEDPAVVTERFALITHPGAETRKGETIAIHHALQEFRDIFYTIEAPGTVEGGDVLQIDDHFYIGLSNRTNELGANQFKAIMEDEGYNVTIVKLKEFFHLKTGITYLGDRRVIAAGEFIDHPDFKEYEQITVPSEEEYAANCLRVNDVVIMPKGYPITKEKIESVGYKTIEVEMSEFRKQDGGLSCLSLRF